MHDLLLRNIRPMAGESCDMLVRDGKIAGFGPFVVYRLALGGLLLAWAYGAF